MLVGAVSCLLVALPGIGVLTTRLLDSQFVRETERSLQAQAALFAEVYAQAYRAAVARRAKSLLQDAAGSPLEEARSPRYDPAEPAISGSLDPLPPAPAPVPVEGPLAQPYASLAAPLSELVRRAKRRTLIGYLATDDTGRIVVSSGTMAGRLAGWPEIESALGGTDMATLRLRGDQTERHPLTSISRNTSFRVFVAHPVRVDGRVVGAVLLSRTPTNLGRFLYRERQTLVLVGMILVSSALIVGVLFWRLISRPIRHLAEQTQAVADQSRPLPEPLAHYGVRELARLGESVLSMARTLHDRAGAIETYTAHVTHELKSPTTAIVGAAEMLGTGADTMPAARREALVRTIHEQGLRMNALLERLRTLARARLSEPDRAAPFADVVRRLRDSTPGLAIAANAAPAARLPLATEQAVIALSQMAANAREHGARKLWLAYDAAAGVLTVRDDGQGIEPANRDRILRPFFTTRRAEGGTGMGLTIAAAIFEASGGVLAIDDAPAGGPTGGAAFTVRWPPGA